VIDDEASAAPTPVIIKKAIAAARQDLNMARCPRELSVGGDRPVPHREIWDLGSGFGRLGNYAASSTDHAVIFGDPI
jgi:hypothetical protein